VAGCWLFIYLFVIWLGHHCVTDVHRLKVSYFVIIIVHGYFILNVCLFRWLFVLAEKPIWVSAVFVVICSS
jgi:hypothetical protein